MVDAIFIGKIRLPKIRTDPCFGSCQKTRLFTAASQSIPFASMPKASNIALMTVNLCLALKCPIGAAS
jgi:hypothetical protein